QPGGRGAVGGLVFVVSAIIVFLGGGQLFTASNGFRDSIYIHPHYVPDPRPALGGGDDGAAQVAWIDQWMKEGKKVYGGCAACHMPDGLGAPGKYPPLVGSEWVDGGTKRLGAILLHGINGPFRVAGQ